jgi:diguanylate cyclase (GGDEF)-like protein
LAEAIEQARRLDRDTLPAAVRTRVALAMGEGLAALGRWQQAYQELHRAGELDKQARELASDAQVLRLQARYDDARRTAEIAALRHRNEVAALALEAEQAHQRTLWAVLAASSLVLTVVAAQAWRVARRRRVLADLALKDELTGSPNRRAVTAYAQAQLDQMRRLNLPFTLALIDLDHFKRVNDGFGHDAGDALLRAFAQAAAEVLRGQDRIGRWGGEEWLLVMPGTALADLPRVFERLRNAFAQAIAEGLPQPHGQTFSMGAVQAGANGAPIAFDELVRAADQCLYRAKDAGRNRLETLA